MNHSARSGRKFRRNQRRLKSLAAQLPEFRQGPMGPGRAPDAGSRTPGTDYSDVAVSQFARLPRAPDVALGIGRKGARFVRHADD